MTANPVLRITAFEDFHGRAQLRVVIETDAGAVKEYGFVLADAHQALEAADKLRMVGNGMLRRAPRPQEGTA